MAEEDQERRTIADLVRERGAFIKIQTLHRGQEDVGRNNIWHEIARR